MFCHKTCAYTPQSGRGSPKEDFVTLFSKNLTNLAEEVRFELTGAFTPAVFKTAAINHSTTLPKKLQIVDSNW